MSAPTPAEAVFPREEHLARFERAKTAIAAGGYDCCVAIGPEMLYYVAGYDAHTHFSRQAIVFGPGDAEPTFVVRDVDLGVAEDTAWVRDLRTYHYGVTNPADLVAQAVQERTRGNGRVGLELGSYAFPGDYALEVVDRIGRERVVDATSLLAHLRIPKTPAEMALVRQAGAYAEIGLKAGAAMRAGMSELEVSGIIETPMRAAGSEYPAMPVWVASGERLRGGHRTPSSRKLRQGDFVTLEFAGVSQRYHAVTMQTFAIGEPSPAMRRLYDASRESLEEGSAVIKAGVPVAEAERRAVASLRKSGYDPTTMARFGYGVGIHYPPTWLEPLDIIVESEQVFESGMSFVLHVGMMLPGERMGVLIGGAYVLGDNGLECMSGGPVDLVVR